MTEGRVLRASEGAPTRCESTAPHYNSSMRNYAAPQDMAAFDADQELGFPGEFPFTRGIQPTMYRGRLWTMRQYAGFGTAAKSNQRYRYLLSQGVNGLSVAFDLPTQIGYDSDHPLAAGEVGRVGVAIDSVEDMATLFDGIPLDTVSTSMTINATAIVLIALYVAVGKRQGVAPKQLSGTIQNDILKEYIARGTYIYPPRQSLRIVTDIFAYCEQNMPRWNTISISGYHIREAGSTAVQEVAFTFANAIAYVQAAIDAGLDVNSFGQRLSFFFNAHNDFLEEVAKFRAARRLWARIMKERFGATNPRAQQLRFHTQTAGSTLTAQQPDNNIVRVAVQALSAVLGGTQSLHTNGRDEALALPTENAAQIALRTQQIIGFESGVTNTVDPFAGSYHIEKLTSEIEDAARELIARIEGVGGTLAAIEAGYIQRQVQDSAYKAQLAVDAGEAVVVGVNRFQTDESSSIEVFQVDPDLEVQQVHRVRQVRQVRDQGRWKVALDEVGRAAQTSDNLVPPIIAAVESHATVGEIADTLRAVFGEYREVSLD
ncbi:MAG: methylmalonyl-CoA mutase [Acidobacteria bacterium]|nr:methylmalonyl-CoA mutase [Acidobacteriota bacterium]